MSLPSRLPPGGENIFQAVKKLRLAREKAGLPCINLGIGQPSGPALLSARLKAAEIIASDSQLVHEYADNGCPPCPDFAPRFVQAHMPGMELKVFGDRLGFLPIPGIKSKLGDVVVACNVDSVRVATMTFPGYSTPADWCRYLRVPHVSVKADHENGFLPGNIPSLANLLMINLPHNPSGAIATRDYWRWLCRLCQELGVRLFNDAAYAGLVYTLDACTLTEVAVEFPGLSWVEAFSGSKTIANGCSWRVGAMVGSPDFIDDIALIKGNTDSGFVSACAIGALHALENDQAGVMAVNEMYRTRLDLLGRIFGRTNMKETIKPLGAFFSLCHYPDKAFGQVVRDARQFNQLMIEHTGLIGIPFGTPDKPEEYVRYTVCGDIAQMAGQIEEAFALANVSY